MTIQELFNILEVKGWESFLLDYYDEDEIEGFPEVTDLMIDASYSLSKAFNAVYELELKQCKCDKPSSATQWTKDGPILCDACGKEIYE